MSKEKQIKTTDWLTRGISKEQLEREKREAIMSADLQECMTYDEWSAREYGADSIDFDTTVEKMVAKGYRKQSENVIELPCKVGDTVYCIEHKTIHECLVTMVKSLTYENRTIFFVEAECEIVSPFYSDGRKIKHGLMAVWEIEWGSWYRAFRMREEAEQVIAKGE